jgi:hypothetical protein
MGFSRPQLVVVSGLFIHDGIPAITRPFSWTFFLFPQWNSGYHEAFLTNFLSFSTMEFWLSWSLSHELSFFFSQWNSGYHEAFLTNFLFSWWNSAYHEAFLMNFSFFTMEFWLSRSLSHELFFFHDGILAITKPFSRTFLFSRWNSENTRFGGRLFLYIYHEEYLHRIRLVKNLASWFRDPFARKRVWSFLF